MFFYVCILCLYENHNFIFFKRLLENLAWLEQFGYINPLFNHTIAYDNLGPELKYAANIFLRLSIIKKKRKN